MSNTVPVVNLEKRMEQCESRLRWDGDSLTLSCALAYARKYGPPNNNLAKEINHLFDIPDHQYRIILGDMDILINSELRIESFEIRTNPADWEPLPLQSLPSKLDNVFVSFLTDYDLNHIASYDVSIRIVWDTSQRQVGFLFGDHASSQWVRVADNIVIGLTLDNYLSELRLTDFTLFG
jgi:hypothetical protein